MSFRAVVFDLDGTLLDTYEDLADSLNAVLAAMGRLPLPAESVKDYIGDGVEALVRRALGDAASPENVTRCAAMFREEYGRRWACKTRPFEGVVELIASLEARKVPIGVLSNKPDAFTQNCVAKLLPADAFDVVLGAKPEIPRKPDPAGARWMAERLGVRPEETLYLGDTATDMQTAVSAGMAAIGATWGYRSADELMAHGAARLISKPEELLQLLDGSAS
jgi:phosphoglycolate phosphatase